jgi:hypothetical protein
MKSIITSRYRSWVILDNDETKISDVYAYTAIDARRRASQRALEALMKKQPSHVNKQRNTGKFDGFVLIYW